MTSLFPFNLFRMRQREENRAKFATRWKEGEKKKAAEVIIMIMTIVVMISMMESMKIEDSDDQYHHHICLCCCHGLHLMTASPSSQLNEHYAFSP